MFSYESFIRLNAFLGGIYRLAYLNLLWIAGTVVGLVVVGVGPASYAVAAYVDRWFRFGETPPVTRTFIAHYRERFGRAALIGAMLTVATAIIVFNIFSATTWMLQFANIVALVVVAIIAAYVFPVLAATDIDTLPRQIASALLLGIGSLHWTIIAGAVTGGAWWALYTYALPLLPVFGIGIPAAAIGFVTRIVFGTLADDTKADTQTSPPRAHETPRARLHLARGTSE